MRIFFTVNFWWCPIPWMCYWFKLYIGNFSRANTLSDPIIAWLDFFSNLIPPLLAGTCSYFKLIFPPRSCSWFLSGQTLSRRANFHAIQQAIWILHSQTAQHLKSLYLSRVWKYELSRFQGGDTKLVRCLPKNPKGNKGATTNPLKSDDWKWSTDKEIHTLVALVYVLIYM